MTFKIITATEQKNNLAKCLTFLKKATTTEELSQVSSQVIKTTDDDFYFMSKAGKDNFWSQYRQAKQNLTA